MASSGAASIRAVCEYPVGVQWDCFGGAEVGEEEMTRLAQTLAARPPLRLQGSGSSGGVRCSAFPLEPGAS